MAERFQKLFSLSSGSYKEGCPVAIVAGALQKDTATGKILAQIKMRNIGAESIKSCKVLLTAYDNYGKKVEDLTTFSYLDLDVRPGEEFGSKTPIFLPFETTRSFSVVVIETVVGDNIIKQFDQSGWNPIPSSKRIEEYLQDNELIKQFKIETGDDSDYYPERNRGLFLCTCGEINMDTNPRCNRCGKNYNALISVLDKANLQRNTERRIEEEQIQKAEAEKQKKKKTKLGIIAGAIICLLVVGIVIINNANSGISKQIKTAGILPGMSSDEAHAILDTKANSISCFGFKPAKLDIQAVREGVVNEVVVYYDFKTGQANNAQNKIAKVMEKNGATISKGKYGNAMVYSCSMNIDGKLYNVKVSVSDDRVHCLITKA